MFCWACNQFISMFLSVLLIFDVLFVAGNARVRNPNLPHENEHLFSSLVYQAGQNALKIHNKGRRSHTENIYTSGIAISKPHINHGVFKYHRHNTSLITGGIPTNQYLWERSKRSGSKKNCNALGKKSNCAKCGFRGICSRGSACVSDWLAFALKTQRELQMDIPLNQQQMLAAHNAYNNRASGYGDLDDCPWPPPYRGICISLANQELSFTDLLNIGIQSLEIDPWYCYGKMRMSHSHGEPLLGCMPWDVELEDGMKEIGEWVNKPENADKIIQIYLDDGHSQTRGYHELVNGPIRRYFGDKVFTPNDLRVRFNGKWPSPREMRGINKTVWFVSMAWDIHKGLYIHRIHWNSSNKLKFLQQHNCTGEKLVGSYRVFGDSTRYGPLYDGPSKMGVILQFKDFLTCGVTYPAADQISSELVQTAVFTWAIHEPKFPLSEDSCVLLGRSGKELRWHVAKCSEKHSFACVSKKDDDHWVSSTFEGIYRSSKNCPDGFSFSIPHNGFQHRKLVEVIQHKDVWLNFTPYILSIKENPRHKCGVK